MHMATQVLHSIQSLQAMDLGMGQGMMALHRTKTTGRLATYQVVSLRARLEWVQMLEQLGLLQLISVQPCTGSPTLHWAR